MDISIVIATLEGGNMLLDCINSVYECTKTPFEIIVVDNGSQDGSAEKVLKAHPDVKVIRNPQNLGFSRAVNLGLELASGKYICLLNNDAKLTQGALDEIVSFMDKNKQCGIAAPQLLNADGSLQNSFDTFPTLATTLLNKSLMRRLLPHKFPSKLQNMTSPTEVESVIGACLFIKRETLNAIGKLCEDYFVFLEETEWCLLARKKNWKVFLLPDIKVYHQQGATKERSPIPAKIEFMSSLFTFFRRNRSAIDYIALRALMPLRDLISLAWLLITSLLTLFLIKSMRERFMICLYRFIWYLLLCPPSMGLQGIRGDIKRTDTFGNFKFSNVSGYYRKSGLSMDEVAKIAGGSEPIGFIRVDYKNPFTHWHEANIKAATSNAALPYAVFVTPNGSGYILYKKSLKKHN